MVIAQVTGQATHRQKDTLVHTNICAWNRVCYSMKDSHLPFILVGTSAFTQKKQRNIHKSSAFLYIWVGGPTSYLSSGWGIYVRVLRVCCLSCRVIMFVGCVFCFVCVWVCVCVCECVCVSLCGEKQKKSSYFRRKSHKLLIFSGRNSLIIHILDSISTQISNSWHNTNSVLKCFDSISARISISWLESH